MPPSFDSLAAAAVVVVAAATVTGSNAVAAAVAQQEDQDDDPAHIPSAKTVVIHSNTSEKLFWRLSRSFHGIPISQKCASG